MRRSVITGPLALALALALAAGCGSSSKGDDDDDAIDASMPEADAGIPPNCGDSRVDPGEECDDGNDDDEDACLSNCRLACGDGRVSTSEECDTAIAAGEEGACPTSCDDADACTTDALSGEACQTRCNHGDITGSIDDDGCCPDGASSLDDNDCTVECGNSVVEDGETCDTGIASGSPGACPEMSDCVDGLVCTTDVLSSGGTCTAACSNPDITDPIDDDGCCPDGATIGDDNDCAGVCGDGEVTSPELCDTAIPSGDAGACPVAADCIDGDACTEDNLVSGGTCNAACTNPAITAFIDGDGCCPPGATEVTDSDCTPVCGNGAVETGEQCDDGGTDPGDGCDGSCQLEDVAFRFTDMDLRDPHTYVNLFGCRDATDDPVFGIFATNTEFQESIQMDTDGDGLLELSPVVVMKPLDQAATTTPMEFLFADCTAPMSSTSCVLPMGTTPTSSTANNMTSGTCLDVISGTSSGYSPSIGTATAGGAGCFVSDAETLTIDISGILITLEDARIAAQYSGSPADGLVNGLVRGFISEADADATILPADLLVVGGEPLSSVLPGGTGNCCNDPTEGCTSTDDRDVGPDGSTLGWYFYLNFEAVVVPYTP